MSQEIFKPGDSVISFTSWASLTIAKVDVVNRYYMDLDGRSVSFDKCQLRERAGVQVLLNEEKYPKNQVHVMVRRNVAITHKFDSFEDPMSAAFYLAKYDDLTPLSVVVFGQEMAAGEFMQKWDQYYLED